MVAGRFATWELGTSDRGIRLGKVARGLPKDPMGRYCDTKFVEVSIHH